MWFSKNKVKTEEELTRTTELILDVVKLKAELERLQQHFLSLRGFVNKKAKLKDFDDEIKEEDEEKSLNSPDGLDDLRILSKQDGGSNKTRNSTF